MGALLSQFMNRYAYTDFHELNADWMIRTMMELINQVENFVSLNAIKYADPIQWNIVSQYEKNTIVIDPLTGTAYISVKPVPSGVALTNTDYWTVVFDLGSFVVRAAKNFTSHYEAETTLTATFPSNVGDWIVWGDVLYEVISPIVAGDQYVVNSNIKQITVEEVCDTLAQAINDIDTKVGDLSDLTTSVTTSVVLAINSVLDDLNVKIGDLNDLDTTDKSSLVDAINEVLAFGGIVINVKNYGAKGDGLADDTSAINDAIAAIGDKHYILYFPKGTYNVSSQLIMPLNSGTVMGDGRMLSTIKLFGTKGFVFTGSSGVELHGFGIVSDAQGALGEYAISLLAGANRINIYDMFFYGNYCDIYMSTSITEVLINGITSFNWTRSSVLAGDTGYCGSINVSNSFFKTDHGLVTNGAIEIKYVDVMNVHGNTLITPLSNNVLIEPEAGQLASLLTFDGNCFDTSANGIYVRGAGSITRLIINGNTVQEMTNAGILIDTANVSYVIIDNNVIFNTPYGVNLAENAVIDDISVSNNIITSDTLALRFAGTTKALKCNTNIIGTQLFGLNLPNGIVAVATIDGVCFGNVFNNVTTPISGTHPNFLVYDYYQGVTPTVSTFTITTDTNGNAALNLTDASIIIDKIFNNQGDFILSPYWDNTNSAWYCHVTDALGSPIASTPFSITITYHN